MDHKGRFIPMHYMLTSMGYAVLSWQLKSVSDTNFFRIRSDHFVNCGVGFPTVGLFLVPASRYFYGS